MTRTSLYAHGVEDFWLSRKMAENYDEELLNFSLSSKTYLLMAYGLVSHDCVSVSSMRVFHKLYLGELCIQSVVFFMTRFKVTACVYFSITNYLKHWFVARVKQQKIISGFNKLQLIQNSRLCYKGNGPCFSCASIELWMHLKNLESTRQAREALGFALVLLVTLLSCSPNFPRASITL